MLKEVIKEKVQKEIVKAEKAIAKSKEMAKPVKAEGAIGRVSRMNDINNKTVALAIKKEATQKLIRLKKVLSLINTKDFGICIRCKENIAIGRILVRPESILCVKCAL